MTTNINHLPHEVPVKIDPNLLEMKNPFMKLFIRDEKRIDEIAKSIKTAYDPACPITCIMVDGKLYVVKGHHRTLAGRKAEKDVIVVIRDYKSEFEAYLDAVHEQGTSRKFNNAELFQCVVTSNNTIDFQKGKQSGKVRTSDPTCLNRGNLKALLASNLGVSEKTIARCFTIIDKATEKQQDLILTGKKSINNIYNEITKKEKPIKEKKYDLVYEKDSLNIVLADCKVRLLTVNPKIRYEKRFTKQFAKLEKEILKLSKVIFNE